VDIDGAHAASAPHDERIYAEPPVDVFAGGLFARTAGDTRSRSISSTSWPFSHPHAMAARPYSQSPPAPPRREYRDDELVDDDL